MTEQMQPKKKAQSPACKEGRLSAKEWGEAVDVNCRSSALGGKCPGQTQSHETSRHEELEPGWPQRKSQPKDWVGSAKHDGRAQHQDPVSVRRGTLADLGKTCKGKAGIWVEDHKDAERRGRVLYGKVYSDSFLETTAVKNNSKYFSHPVSLSYSPDYITNHILNQI